MNKHFSTIGKKLANKLQSTNACFSDYLKNPNPKSFFLYEAEEIEVKNLILDCSNKSDSIVLEETRGKIIA